MLFVLAAALLQAATPGGTPTAPRPSVITMPDWVRKPTGEDMERYYPASAQQRDLPGRATVECMAVADGTLTNCHVIEESPAGEGFGEAALKLAHNFTMRPMTKGGQPVGGAMIRIPIRFALSGKIDAFSAELSCYGQVAAMAEGQPDSVEAWTAVTFFAAQVAAQAANAKSSPTQFEESLRSAHLAAARTTKPSPLDPALSRCLDLATSHMKPVVRSH